MAKLVPVIILAGSSEPTAGSGIIDGAAEGPKTGALPSAAIRLALAICGQAALSAAQKPLRRHGDLIRR
jgi:hypothetical protein